MGEFVKKSWIFLSKNIVLAAIVAVATLFLLSSVDPFNLSTPQKAAAAAAAKRLEIIPISSGATGPESLAFDPDGQGPYTGVSDGRILKWHQHRWLEYAVVSPPSLSAECKGSQDPEREDLCGRPLGLTFDKKTRNLYIADAYFGLLMVSPDEKFANPIVTQAEGHPFNFTNSLDIDQGNGIIYFTDSSMRFQRRDFMSAVTARDNTGRLIKYGLHNEEVQVLLSGLYIPNGVLLSQDGSFLLIAETTTCRILRYWLEPPKTGRLEVLVQLPGLPDNIKRSPRGGFWVAMHPTREGYVDCFMLPHGREVIELPFVLDRANPFITSGWTDNALAMRISEEGEILEVMEDFGSEMVKSVSEVGERNETLWIGSSVSPYFAVYRL